MTDVGAGRVEASQKARSVGGQGVLDKEVEAGSTAVGLEDK